MKKLITVLGIVFLLLSIAYSLWYYNRIKDNKQISKKNESFIQAEIFTKDSENRGFSDEAKILMDEDLAKVNNDPQIKKLYSLYEKSYRKLALSNSKKEFTSNFIKMSQTRYCLGNIKTEKYTNVNLDNLHFNKKGEEHKKIKKVVDTLSQEFVSNNTFAENHALLNSFPTEKQCEDFLNE